MTKKEVTIITVAGLYILLFFYTAFSKWLNFPDFQHQMANQPFDRKYLPLLLYGLPSVELLAVLLLIPERTRLIGFYSCLALMLIFTGYIILIKLNYYGRIPCSCGGIIKKLSWTQHLLLNIFFIGLAALGIAFQRKLRHTNLVKNQTLSL